MKKTLLLVLALAASICVSAKEMSRIHVEGKNFVDENGKTIVFKGLCFSDPVKLISENKWDEDYFSEAASWNANVVRFPIHPQYLNRYGWDKTFEAIDRGIEWAKQLGMYVIIDWHSIGNLKEEKYTSPMYNTTMEETFRFWHTAAQRYKDEPAVALYELFNEPTIGQKGLGKCSWDEWRNINEQLIDTIRAINPKAVCICAGFDWAYKLTDVKAKPIRRQNIAYVSHPYPMKRDQPWEEKWEKDFGYVADNYPVICTEIGYCLESERGAHVPVKSTDVYGDHITKYFEQKGISFTIWCFDPHWAPTLFTDWNYTLSTQGRYFKKYLQSLPKSNEYDENIRTISDNNTRLTWIKDMPGDSKQGKRVFNDTPNEILKELHLEEGIPSSMSCFLMEVDGDKILFDTGLGGKNSLLHQSLAKLGTNAEQIKRIFITHLHGDHIGGLVDGTEKIFPNAEIYLNKVEYDAWMAMPADRNAQQKNILSIYADQLHLFTVDEKLPYDIQPLAAYGHTPGHTIFQKGKLLVIGDLMHGAALQMVHPEYCPSYDMDKPTAIESRKKFIKYAADNKLIMAGMHLPSPGYIK